MVGAVDSVLCQAREAQSVPWQRLLTSCFSMAVARSGTACNLQVMAGARDCFTLRVLTKF